MKHIESGRRIIVGVVSGLVGVSLLGAYRVAADNVSNNCSEMTPLNVLLPPEGGNVTIAGVMNLNVGDQGQFELATASHGHPKVRFAEDEKVSISFTVNGAAYTTSIRQTREGLPKNVDVTCK